MHKVRNVHHYHQPLLLTVAAISNIVIVIFGTIVIIKRVYLK